MSTFSTVMPNTTLHGCRVLTPDDRTKIRYYCASFIITAPVLKDAGVAGTAAGDYDFCCELLAQNIERLTHRLTRSFLKNGTNFVSGDSL